MSTAWLKFVSGVLQGEPDDPFVHLLVKRLGSGYTVVRINLTTTTKGPVYVLLLSHLRQLSKMEVPHSPSFTRWSLANGMRMNSREEEEQRWAALAAERFQTVADDVGAEQADRILLDRLRVLAPPRAAGAIQQESATRTTQGREQLRALRKVDAFLGSLAGDLGGALRYPAEEAADILDGALERWVRALDPRARVRKAVMLRSVGEAAPPRGGRAR